ncbi:class I SAM-dependent methyltransferase [Streptomyces sp. NPDC047725]|uniref:class I SAM-dependent methyltransferase n=1 Tax=Streptomyces sp. NPDC047725 TaxID=3365487 RepID=UPI0037118C96
MTPHRREVAGTTNADARTTRVREVRRRLTEEGPPRTRERQGDFKTVSVPERHCDRLRDLLVAERAEKVVEVGLAYAGSALAIGEALTTVGRPLPRHVVIDPFQESEYGNAGWDLLRAAGLDSIATLMPVPSSVALPQLLTEGFVADAAFVDGSHRFHEVFVDLYFLRGIVRPGGLIVIDDDWWPSVHTAARYYEQNLGWTEIPDAFPGGATGAGPRDGDGARCKAYRLPDPSFEPSFEDFRAF